MTLTLCMINARGGSRGVPRKNIKTLSGKPLIHYAIDTAKQVSEINRIVVSTEDEEIAEIAREAGADVPFMRPHELATDAALQIDTIMYTLERLQNVNPGVTYDRVVLLQPTVPLRKAEDVSGCIQLHKDTNADTVISVVEVGGRHPEILYKKSKNNALQPYLETSQAGINRQNLDKLYWRTGGVYVIRSALLLEERKIYGADIKGYEVGEDSAFNIDSPFDWELAEAWAKHRIK
ncbi:MAG: acylneuraminate cytidylyltransferase family protein [Alphaproteobacteria bacterium]